MPQTSCPGLRAPAQRIWLITVKLYRCPCPRGSRSALIRVLHASLDDEVLMHWPLLSDLPLLSPFQLRAPSCFFFIIIFFFFSLQLPAAAFARGLWHRLGLSQIPLGSPVASCHCRERLTSTPPSHPMVCRAPTKCVTMLHDMVPGAWHSIAHCVVLPGQWNQQCPG
jgi:hypothetical protein